MNLGRNLVILKHTQGPDQFLTQPWIRPGCGLHGAKVVLTADTGCSWNLVVAKIKNTFLGCFCKTDEDYRLVATNSGWGINKTIRESMVSDTGKSWISGPENGSIQKHVMVLDNSWVIAGDLYLSGRALLSWAGISPWICKHIVLLFYDNGVYFKWMSKPSCSLLEGKAGGTLYKFTVSVVRTGLAQTFKNIRIL